jgi:hypothetical protein
MVLAHSALRRQIAEHFALRSFSDAKQLHGHRYAQMRGPHQRVHEQCLLAATAQNMKKIALLLSRMQPSLSGARQRLNYSV